MGHVAVKKHLNITGLFDGNPDCRFCSWKLKECTIFLSAAARPWLISAIISLGSSL
jgi:hypothetical protein